MSIEPIACIIRKAKSGDEFQLSELNRDFNGTTPPAEQIRLALESLPEVVLVAEEAGSIRGFWPFR